MHVLDELPPSVEGAQERDASCTDTTKFSVLVTDAAPVLAVRTTVSFALTSAPFAMKLALLWPADTVTVPGTKTSSLLLFSVITVALAAPWFSDTVHVLDELLPSAEGAQEKDASCAVTTKFSVLVNDAPPALAVRTTVSFAVTSAPFAVKLALVCPAVTVTAAGTVTFW